MHERAMHEHGVSGRPVQDRRAGERRQAQRRRANGPRPVRPAVNAVAVRPAEVERPRVARPAAERRATLPAPGVRLLVRRPPVAPPAAPGRVRRVLAGLAVAVAAGAVVVGLGLLADVATGARAAEGAAVLAPRSSAEAGAVIVTVGSERTAWDVARRVAPGASGPEVAALAERIVTDNSLTPVPLRPGQVLTVTVG